MGIQNGVNSARGDVVAAITSLVSAAAAAASNAVSGAGFSNIGYAIDQGIASGISSGSGIIASAARNAAYSAYNAAKSALGIASPSKKGAYLGAMFDTGVAEGISDNAQAVADAAGALADLAAEEAESGFAFAPSMQQQAAPFDYAAMKDAMAQAITETGAGQSIMVMDGRIVGETTEPYSSRASYQRSQKTIKGRASRLIMI